MDSFTLPCILCPNIDTSSLYVCFFISELRFLVYLILAFIPFLVMIETGEDVYLEARMESPHLSPCSPPCANI